MQTMQCPRCDGSGGCDAPHPAWGSRTCPEAYVHVKCDLCAGSGERPVSTRYWAKPIPVRFYDWQAVDPDTYDGPGSPIGHGETEAEAIANLASQLV